MAKKIPRTVAVLGIHLEVTPGFEPGNQGFADPCLTTWLCHHRGHLYYMRLFSKSPHLFLDFDAHTFVWASSGAGNEARTRYLHLGKVALYRMSYTRISNADMIIADFFQKSRADAKFPEKKSPGGQKLCPPSTHVSNLRGMKQGGNKFGSALTAAYTAAACGRPDRTPARSAPASPRDRRTARARRS